MGAQVKDAYNRLVANTRSFLIDACYIYLCGVGRKGFSQNPQDANLIEGVDASVALRLDEQKALRQQLATCQQEQEVTAHYFKKAYREKQRVLLASARWMADRNQWATVRKDLNILPYQPAKVEIDSLSGI